MPAFLVAIASPTIPLVWRSSGKIIIKFTRRENNEVSSKFYFFFFFFGAEDKNWSTVSFSVGKEGGEKFAGFKFDPGPRPWNGRSINPPSPRRSMLDVGGNSMMFAWPRCAAEFLALLERFYFGYLIGYESTSPIFDILFARGTTPLWPASRYRNAYRSIFATRHSSFFL